MLHFLHILCFMKNQSSFLLFPSFLFLPFSFSDDVSCKCLRALSKNELSLKMKQMSQCGPIRAKVIRTD